MGVRLRAGLTGAAAASVVAVLFFVFASGLQDLFGFEGVWVVMWLVVGLVLSLGLSAMRGAIQGTQRFARLGMVMLSEATLRLAVAGGLVALGFGVAGAAAGFTIGYAGALGLAVWWLRPRGAGGRVASTHLWRVLREQAPAAWAAFGVFGVQAIDVVVANAQLPGEQLEAYAAAALAGRIMFWAGFVLSLLALPRFREMFASRSFDRTLVLGTFGALAVLLGGVLAVGAALPGCCTCCWWDHATHKTPRSCRHIWPDRPASPPRCC